MIFFDNESTSLLSLARHVQSCKKKHNIIDNTSVESSDNYNDDIVENPQTEIIKNNKKSYKKS